MADDSGLTAWINTTDSDSGYTIVNTSDPVEWGRVGTSILLSVVATLYVAFQEYITAVIGNAERYLNALSSFVGDVNPDGIATGSGVLGELFVPILQWYRQDLWASSVEQFGVLGYLAALVFTLTMLYVVVRGLKEAAQRLTGGG